jgi:hypothetical protein
VTYAHKSRVPVAQTRGEIEKVLAKYGATGFAYGSQAGRTAVIAFQTHARSIKFVLPLTPPAHLSQNQAAQFERSRWRALLLSIKAKLEAVESGIESFDSAFLSNVVMPNGQTMAEVALPYIKDAYAKGSMPPMLTFNGS